MNSYSRLKIAALILSLIVPIQLSAEALNSVRTIRPLMASTSEPVNSYDMSMITVNYFDGLGRDLATVEVGSSYGVYDMVSFTSYDSFGRVKRRYLPYVTDNSDGSLPMFDLNRLRDYRSDNFPYSETTYFSDTETREQAITGPGEIWHSGGHSINTDERFNERGSSKWSCAVFAVTDGGTLVNEGEYATGSLYVKVTTDENGDKTADFTDRNGRKLLVRRFPDDNTMADTYFVYDDWGDLRYVLPPEASTRLSVIGPADEVVLGLYAFIYEYDQRHRVVKKQIPGAGVTEYVYGLLDLPLFSRDEDGRGRGEWTVYKYDCLHRPVVKAIITTDESRSSLQSRWGDTILTENRDKSQSMEFMLQYGDSYGLPGYRPVMAWYYDDYSHWSYDSDHPGLWQTPEIVEAMAVSARGLCTGTAMITDDGYTYVTVDVRDRDGRQVFVGERDLFWQEYISTTFNKYNFIGTLGRSVRHTCLVTEGEVSEGDDYTEDFIYSYDNRGRMLSVSVSVNGSERMPLTMNILDDDGRVTSVMAAQLTPVRFERNIRGWTTSVIGHGGLDERLEYETGSDARFDGSISSKSEAGVKVSYDYDRLGRLVRASSADRSFWREAFLYDLNGNIVRLSRGTDRTESFEKPVDDSGMAAVASVYEMLDMIYDGNRLVRVDRLSDEPAFSGNYEMPHVQTESATLAYDGSGRVVSDASREISQVIYNRDGLPTRIVFNGGYVNAFYRPDGVLRSRNTSEREVATATSSGLDSKGRPKYINHNHSYYGPLEITNRVRRLRNDWGYVEVTADTVMMRYYVRDYMGNVRVVADGSGEILQTTSYMSGGLPVEPVGKVRVDDRLHCGKPYLGVHSLGWYDNNARIHDALLCRFTSPDPLAEKYPDMSPYVHCANNPLIIADLNGMNWLEIDKKGYTVRSEACPGPDIIKIVEKDDNDAYYVVEQATFDPGTLLSNSVQSSLNGKYNLICINGHENSVSVFEFLAINTNVEWSLSMYLNSNNKYYELTSSHLSNNEYGASDRLSYYSTNCTIMEQYHSHPYNTSRPSGLDFEATGEAGDIQAAQDIEKYNPNVVLKLFLPQNKLYIEYNSRSKQSDFGIKTSPKPYYMLLGN